MICSPKNIRVVVYIEEGMWIAQALEYDLCTQGFNLKTLKKRILDTLLSEQAFSLLEGREAWDIDPAPSRFFKMWDQRSPFSFKCEYDDLLVEAALVET